MVQLASHSTLRSSSPRMRRSAAEMVSAMSIPPPVHTIARFSGVRGPRLRCRQADIGKLPGLIVAGANGFLQRAKIGARFHFIVDARRIKERADRIGGEIRRCAHDSA